MKEVEIEIPADAKTVTLELERHGTFTLRSLLPQAKCEVELVLEDVQGKCSCDRLRMKANCGQELLLMIQRSHVLDAARILDSVPILKVADAVPTMLNGTFSTLTGTSCLQLFVALREDEG